MYAVRLDVVEESNTSFPKLSLQEAQSTITTSLTMLRKYYCPLWKDREYLVVFKENILISVAFFYFFISMN